MNTAETPRILSIQSHVVSGYVGNKSATFPLQLLGFEVDTINSVQFSNHTGYKVTKGQILNDEDLATLMDGLEQNNIDKYNFLLTGYVASVSFLNCIIEVVKKLKKRNPNLIYVCDPVMGDNGKMYVPAELKDIYRDQVVPLADIVTPNQYELELLTGRTVNTMSELKEAIQELRTKGPKIVAVSSTEIDNKLTSVVSSYKDNEMYVIEIPKIPALYTGSGDLFAALFLAYSHLESSTKVSLEKTINTLHTVLQNTYEYSQTLTGENLQRSMKIELRLIQSKKVIENPSIKLHAQVF